MRNFRFPLIVTGFVLAVALIFGLAAVTWIHKSKISDRQKIQRAEKLGTATAVIMCLAITPFWLIAAARVGKERRKARDAAQLPGNHPQ